MLSPNRCRAHEHAGPLLLCALLGACWADFPDPGSRPASDGATWPDGPRRDGAVPPPRADRAVPSADLRRADGPAWPRADQRVLPDRATSPADLGADGASPASLAKICTGEGTCPTGELCVFMDPGATKGVCLSECTQPNTKCSTPDPRYLSVCMLYPSANLGPVTVCLVLCRYQGQTYPCPSSALYCESYVPGVRVCAPQN